MQYEFSGHFVRRCRERGYDPEKLKEAVFNKQGRVLRHERDDHRVVALNGIRIVLVLLPGRIFFKTVWMDEMEMAAATRRKALVSA